MKVWLLFMLVLLGGALGVAAAEQKPLTVEVFNSGEAHMGLAVNSAIILGESDAVVVDAQFTLSNAHRLVAAVLETGRNPTHVFITHVHPDHFMGLSVLAEAFPDMRVVSIAATAADVNASFPFKIAYWGKKVLGVNGAKTSVHVETLDEPVIMLEGRRLEILGPFQGDAANSTAVWIPSIRTLVASDVVFADSHVWLSAGKTPALRQQWLDVLDRLEALDPEVVVPGHAPDASYLDPNAIAFTRDYIRTFIAKMAETADATALMAAMNTAYPDAKLNFCLDYSAKILKDKWTWEGQWPESLRNMTAQ